MSESNRVLDWDVPLYKQGVEDFSIITVTNCGGREVMLAEPDREVSIDGSSMNGSKSIHSAAEEDDNGTVTLRCNSGKCLFYYCKWSTKTSEVYKYFMRSRFKNLTDELMSQYVLVRAKDPSRVLSLSRTVRDNGLENNEVVLRKIGRWRSL